MSKIAGGLDDWPISEADLEHLKNKASIRVHLAYPGYKTVLTHAPAARRREIARILREEFSALKRFLKDVPFEKIGSAVRPGGAKVDLPLDRVAALVREAFVGHVSIDAIEGFAKKEPEPTPGFWSIKARFAIQIEAEASGLQKYEDRIVLIRALDAEDAQKKLLKAFESYEAPYLNASGRLVRWKFETFLDAYCVSAYSAEDFLREEGVEVFSELRNRKIKPEHVWKLNG
jgi:hypothetical protein